MTKHRRLLAVALVLWVSIETRSEATQSTALSLRQEQPLPNTTQEIEKSAQGEPQEAMVSDLQNEASSGRDAGPLALADAISFALAHSPTLYAAQQQVAGKTAQVTQATANLLPKLDVLESFTRSDNPAFAFSSKLNQGRLTQGDFDLNRLNHPGELNNFRTTFSFVQPLYTGGRAMLGVEQARLHHAASTYALTRQQQEVIFQVVKAYYGILLAQERLAVVQSALRTAEANVRFAQDRFDTGLMVESDVLSARVRFATLQEQQITAQQQLTLAWATLNDVMGLPLTARWTLRERLSQRTNRYPDLATLEAQALEHRPDYVLLGVEEQAAKRSVALAQAAFWPTLNATAQYEMNNLQFATDGQDSWFVGIVLQWNLFNGRADRARVAEARAQVRQLQAQRTRLASRVQLAVKEAFFQLKAAEARIEVAKTAIIQAEAALRIVTDRYRAGLSMIVDLLGNEAALTQAKGNLTQALHDQLVSAASLEFALGTISQEGF